MGKKSFHRKPYKARKKQSIFKNRFLWFSIFGIFLAGGIFYLIYFLPFIQINEVNTIGTEQVSSDEIKNIALQNIGQKIAFFESKSILFVDLTKIKNDILDNFPQIGKVDIKRALPNKLFIDAKEREPFCLFCKSDIDCWYFDKEGIAFEWVQNNLLPMIKIKNTSYASDIQSGDKVIDKGLLDKIVDLNNKIINYLKINIAEFVIPSQGRLNVKTTDGWEIYFEPAGDLNWQVTELGLVLQQEIPPEKVSSLEYIDLRYSKVFYKYK